MTARIPAAARPQPGLTDLDGERWLPVEGAPHYEVSSLGRFRSLDRVTVDQLGRRTPRQGRIVRTSDSGNGYRQVTLGALRVSNAHTLVLAAFVGPRPTGMHACHRNGNGHDNRLSNLRWDTVSQNLRDKVRHGTDHNASKRTCPRGHRLAGPNLKSGRAKMSRMCLACAKAHARSAHLKKKTGSGIAFDSAEFKTLADGFYADILAGKYAPAGLDSLEAVK